MWHGLINGSDLGYKIDAEKIKDLVLKWPRRIYYEFIS